VIDDQLLLVLGGRRRCILSWTELETAATVHAVRRQFHVICDPTSVEHHMQLEFRWTRFPLPLMLRLLESQMWNVFHVTHRQQESQLSQTDRASAARGCSQVQLSPVTNVTIGE